MADKTQSLKNHARLYPAWHFIAFPILAINVIVTIVSLVKAPTLSTGWDVLVAFALVLCLFTSRVMALTNQDRIIRDEERLRLHKLLPDDKRKQIDALSLRQLIALRFASDADVVGLAERCFSGELEDQKAIKESITDWRADWHRV